MTIEEANKLGQELTDKGYRKYTCCLSSTEDYGYFKSCDVTYDENHEAQIGYQIEFRFWNWTKLRRKLKIIELKLLLSMMVINYAY